MTLDRFLADISLLDALAQAVIVTDTEGEVLAWNAAASRLYGYTTSEIVGRNIIELVVNPGEHVDAGAIMSEVLAGRAWQGEFPVRRKDGTAFLARVTDTPVRDETGAVIGIVGISEDVTEEKLRATEAADRERRLGLALAAGQLGTWQYDASTGSVVWDERLEAIYGLAPGTFPGTYDAYLSLLDPDERDEVTATVRRVLAEGGRFQVRHRVRWPDGTVRWVEGHGHATVDQDGKVTGAIGCSRDITESVATAEHTELTRRLAEDLARTYTAEEVGTVVRGHAREALGAVCGAVLLLDAPGRRLVPAARFGYPAEVPGRWAAGLDSGTPAAVAVRTGQAAYFPTAAELRAAHPALAPDHEALGSSSLACLPLVAAGTPVGALVLGFGTEHAFDEQERGLLVALAGHTAQAVERARLVGRLRRISGVLQHGLAPDEVPRVPGLELSARYHPGGDELEEVGGDWYDVVAHPDGRVSLVVGDVMGRGVEAAAAMIRLRSAVRAYATQDPDPVRVLDLLDGLVASTGDENLLTVLCALVDPATGRVDLASAGHLPALLVDADGAVSWVEQPPSPPIGLTREPRFAASRRLRPGTALLAFTDGLVERPDRAIDDGLAQLAAAAARLARRRPPLAALVRELVEDLGAEDSGDDVTVLAARWMPQPAV